MFQICLPNFSWYTDYNFFKKTNDKNPPTFIASDRNIKLLKMCKKGTVHFFRKTRSKNDITKGKTVLGNFTCRFINYFTISIYKCDFFPMLRFSITEKYKCFKTALMSSRVFPKRFVTTYSKDLLFRQIFLTLR